MPEIILALLILGIATLMYFMFTAATLGDLRRQGKLIEVVCTKCGHAYYVDPRELPFSDRERVSNVHKRLKCPKCRAFSGYSRVDARLNPPA
jgi:hypothetical protein